MKISVKAPGYSKMITVDSWNITPMACFEAADAPVENCTFYLHGDAISAADLYKNIGDLIPNLPETATVYLMANAKRDNNITLEQIGAMIAVKSDYSKEEIAAIEKYAPEYLKKTDCYGNVLFEIVNGEGEGEIGPQHIAYGTQEIGGKASLILHGDTERTPEENRQAFLDSKFAPVIAEAMDIEENFETALAKVETRKNKLANLFA